MVMETLLELCRTSELKLFVYVVADLVTALSYLMIPGGLTWVLVKWWREFPWWVNGILVLSCLFILTCGTTHLTHAIETYWFINSWWQGYTRLATAVVSFPTGLVFLFVVLPRLVQLFTGGLWKANREMYHNIGNSLAKMRSCVVHLSQEECLEEFDKLAKEFNRRYH
jgi:putative component of membrane protein insertase Oxa1/YidC/SpoIIIJ protein YidD